MINHDNRQKGMTLLELMVVVAIGSIVVMMAIPSFSKMNAHLNLKGAGQTMVMDLRRAQSLAVRQNSLHQVDFTLDTPITLPDGSQYDAMYQVNCAAGCATDSLPPARYLGAPSSTVSLVSSVDGAGDDAASISFASNGYVSVPTATPFRITIRSTQTGETLCVQVFRTGRISTSLITPPAVC